MTTYAITGHFGKSTKQEWQWNFINSSSVPITISLAVENPFLVPLTNDFYEGPDGLSTTLWDSVLSSSQIAGDSAIPSTVTVVYGDYWYSPLSEPIEVAAGSTLAMGGFIETAVVKTKSIVKGTNEATIYVNGNYALFTYGYNALVTQQDVNIEGSNGFSVSVNTATQNNVIGNGVEIQNGGAGGKLETINMCFQVADLGAVSLGTQEDDTITGNRLNNLITSYAGADFIRGLEGDDYINAGIGNDSIEGGVGNDILLGQEGNDELYGGIGRDLLEGGLGSDILNGGVDADIFAFTTRVNQSEIDCIADFMSHQNDKISISRDAFGISREATASFARAKSRRSLSRLLGSEIMFILNESSGELYFNSNGAAAGSGSGGGGLCRYSQFPRNWIWIKRIRF